MSPSIFHCLICGDSCRPSSNKVLSMMKVLWVWEKWEEVLPLLIPEDNPDDDCLCVPFPSKDAKVCPKCKLELENLLQLTQKIQNLEKELRKSVSKLKNSVAKSQNGFPKKAGNVQDIYFRERLIESSSKTKKNLEPQLDEDSTPTEIENIVVEVEISEDCDYEDETTPEDNSDPDFPVEQASVKPKRKISLKSASPRKKGRKTHSSPTKTRIKSPKTPKTKQTPVQFFCTEPRCPKFQKKFYSRTSLNYHEDHSHLALSVSDKYPCPLCNAPRRSEQDLEKHLPTHGDRLKEDFLYECSHCLLRFLHESTLLAHKTRKHGVVYQKRERATEKCPVCQLFVKPSDMEYHSWTHKGSQELVTALNSFQPVPPTVLTSKTMLTIIPDLHINCQHCSRSTTFKTFTQLSNHLKEVHADLHKRKSGKYFSK